MTNLIVNVEHPPKLLPLGFENEDNFRPIEFHFDSWLERYPGGAFSVVYQRPDGTTLIPIGGATESPVLWAPGTADVAYEGQGEMQLLYQIPDTITGLSAVFSTIVARSLISAGNVSTEPSWVMVVTEAAARVELAETKMPTIGPNGNWFIWDTDAGEYADSGVSAGADVDPEDIETAVSEYFRKNPIKAPVDSVNGKTGVVTLDAGDVGALSDDVSADPDSVYVYDGTSWAVVAKNAFKTLFGIPSSSDIPAMATATDMSDWNAGKTADAATLAVVFASAMDSLNALATRLNAVANSDDTTLDQLSEIVAYIKNNKSLIDSVTTSKVNVSDIVDTLVSTDATKPLSANQGRALKALIDAIPALPTLARVATSGSYDDLLNTPRIPPDPTWCGAWNSSTQYHEGCFVSYNGAIYRCEIDALGQDPDEAQYWSKWFDASDLRAQSVLTFDSAPTQGSNNPVTSGGVYNVLGGIETLLAAL